MLFTFVFTLFRSSHRRCFIKKVVLKNFAIFAWKQLCWSLCLIKLQHFRSVTLFKKTPTQVSSCDYCEIFKTTYLAATVNSEVCCSIRIVSQKRVSEFLSVFEFINKNVIYKKNFIFKEKSGAIKKALKLRSIISFILEIWY